MKKSLVYLTILVFAIVIIPLCNSRYVSLPMQNLMYCSPLLYLAYYKRIEPMDWAALFLLLSIALTSITHPEVFRLSTVMYSCMFVTMFLAFTKFLPNSGFSIRDLNKLCANIIFAYAIIQIIQQAGMITHTYVVNGSYNLGMNGVLLKVNDFTAEASHTGRVIVAIALGFIKSEEVIKGGEKLGILYYWKNYRKLCIALIYISFGTVSVACAMGFFLLLMYFIPRRHVFWGIGSFAMLFGLFLLTETEIASRIRSLIPALIHLDARNLFSIDASSAARIGPYILYIEDFKFADFNTWFGYGCDYGGLHAYSTMANAEAEENMGVGGFVNQLYDYGLVFLFAFVNFLSKIIKLKSFECFLYITIFSTCVFNIHILWIFFYIVYTYNYLKIKELC